VDESSEREEEEEDIILQTLLVAVVQKMKKKKKKKKTEEETRQELLTPVPWLLVVLSLYLIKITTPMYLPYLACLLRAHAEALYHLSYIIHT